MKHIGIILIAVTGILLWPGQNQAKADVRFSVHVGSGYHGTHYYRTSHCGPRYYSSYYRPVPTHYYRPVRKVYYRPSHRVVHYRSYSCYPRRVVVCR